MTPTMGGLPAGTHRYFLELLVFEKDAGKRGDDPVEDHEYEITETEYRATLEMMEEITRGGRRGLP